MQEKYHSGYVIFHYLILGDIKVTKSVYSRWWDHLNFFSTMTTGRKNGLGSLPFLFDDNRCIL